MANKDNSLVFTSIANGHIFYNGFANFTNNNSIIFKNNIAFIYGANGTGKTSLLKVLSKHKDTTYKCTYNNKPYETKGETLLFYTIQDQNARNIIEGNVDEYLIGSNIKEEMELKNKIDEKYKNLREQCVSILKNYGIKTKDFILSKYLDHEYFKLFSDFANSHSKGLKYKFEDFRDFLNRAGAEPLSKIEETDEVKFIISDTKDKSSILVSVLEFEKTFPKNPISDVENIEPRNEAIRVLKRFGNKHKCVICDTEINPTTLLEQKKKEQDALLSSLPKELKDFFKILFEKVDNIKDPFTMKDKIIDAIRLGKKNLLEEVVKSIQKALEKYQQNIISQFAESLSSSGLQNLWDKYQEMIEHKPDFSDDDMQIIEGIINNNMRHFIEFKRDETTQNWRIILYEDKDRNNCSKVNLLGTEREKLFLSTGEQNFISLSFEFLKARNSKCPIVVIDDPISSFDSIYKNKVIFALMNILKDKAKLVLTHNLDAIYLANGQNRACRSLYLFNNTEKGENGFISVNDQEHNLLIDLADLLTFFREKAIPELSEGKLKYFLMAMIPFMRGVASILGKKTLFNDLSSVMHGYKNNKIDLIDCYLKLFKVTEDDSEKSPNELNWDKLEKLPRNEYQISVADILQLVNTSVLSEESFRIFERNDFPLLNKTLRHSLIYLYLRLLVEKTLTNKYPSILDKNQELQLGEIIDRAFPYKSLKEKKKFRIELLSKKTLLNDFNHFENDISIFQPALDISDQALYEEKDLIENVLKDIEDYTEE